MLLLTNEKACWNVCTDQEPGGSQIVSSKVRLIYEVTSMFAHYFSMDGKKGGFLLWRPRRESTSGGMICAYKHICMVWWTYHYNDMFICWIMLFISRLWGFQRLYGGLCACLIWESERELIPQEEPKEHRVVPFL